MLFVLLFLGFFDLGKTIGEDIGETVIEENNLSLIYLSESNINFNQCFFVNLGKEMISYYCTFALQ